MSFILFLSFFTDSLIKSQSVEWNWIKTAGEHSKCSAIGYSVCFDSKSNIYIAGNFHNAISFFNDTTATDSTKGDTCKISDLISDTAIFSKGQVDIFIAKYDCTGKFIWAKSAGGKDLDNCSSITTDNNDNIYITGYFTGPAKFEDTTIISFGSKDAFIAKYDHTGKLIWIEQEGGRKYDTGQKIISDDKYLYLAGHYKDISEFGDTTLYASSGSPHIFISKYDTSGSLIWIRSAGNIDDMRGNKVNDIAIDRNKDIIITGAFTEESIFSNDTLTPVGNYDIFLTKYSNTGELLWIKQAGGIYMDEGYSVAIDEKNNIYAAGCFQDNAIFPDTVLPGGARNDIFIAKFNESGDMVWLNKIDGPHTDVVNSIAYSNNNIYMTGYFWELITLGDTTFTSRGKGDIFTVKYDTDGILQWAEHSGGESYDDSKYVILDHSDNIYITGYFEEAASFGTDFYITKGGRTMFLCRIIEDSY